MLRWIVRYAGLGTEHHASKLRDQLLARVVLVVGIHTVGFHQRVAIEALVRPCPVDKLVRGSAVESWRILEHFAIWKLNMIGIFAIVSAAYRARLCAFSSVIAWNA